MKWSGVRKVGDGEYCGMLEERVLRVEAEIAVVEEEVERLRGVERREKSEEGEAGRGDGVGK